MNWMVFLNHFKTIKVSKPAEIDLKGIASYTLKHWGESQKNTYLNLFKQFFINLSRRDEQVLPLLKNRDDIDSGLLSCNIQKHVVYLRLTTDEILVVRILHSGMDPERHLLE